MICHKNVEDLYGSLFPLRRIADRWPCRNQSATPTARQRANVYIAEASPKGSYSEDCPLQSLR